MRRIAWLLALAGCGNSTPQPCQCPADLATAKDAAAADFSTENDLATPDDLATASDFARAPDQASAVDLAGADLGGCKATMGYANNGNPPQCGESGMCGGHSYAIDCNGMVCTCSVDGNATKMFAQGAACNNLDGAWSSACHF